MVFTFSSSLSVPAEFQDFMPGLHCFNQFLDFLFAVPVFHMKLTSGILRTALYFFIVSFSTISTLVSFLNKLNYIHSLGKIHLEPESIVIAVI